MKQGFEYFGYGDGFRIFTGLFEIVAGIVIIVSIWIKLLALIGGLMVALTMIGVILTHVKMKDELKSMTMPFVLFFLGAIVSLMNWTYLFR